MFRNKKRYRRCEPFSVAFRKGMLLMATVVFVLLFAVFSTYFAVSSHSGQQGYILEREQQERLLLEARYRLLEQDVVRSKSAESISGRRVLRGMTEADQPVFYKGVQRVSQK